MNYFEFFEIPIQFYPDLALVNQIYKKNIKANHPDLNEGELNSENLTALNNNAFKTLKNERKRIAYVLDYFGFSTEGKGAVLPPDILMEMMELNEELADIAMEAGDVSNILQKVENQNAEIWNNIAAIGKQADCADLSINEACTKIKQLYLQSNYMLRILENHTTNL